MTDRLSLSLYARNINAFSINSFRRFRIPSPHPLLPLPPVASPNPDDARMQPDHASLRDDKPERMLSRVYLLGIISQSIFCERRFAPLLLFLSLLLLLFLSLRIETQRTNERRAIYISINP